MGGMVYPTSPRRNGKNDVKRRGRPPHFVKMGIMSQKGGADLLTASKRESRREEEG